MPKTLVIIPILGSLNLLTSTIIQNFDLWHVKNYSQELFRFGWLSVLLILIVGFFVVLQLNLYQKYPLLGSIILVGMACNILERASQGYVVDYFNFHIGVANLADIEIYLGSIIIAYKEFIKTRYDS